MYKQNTYKINIEESKASLKDGQVQFTCVDKEALKVAKHSIVHIADKLKNPQTPDDLEYIAETLGAIAAVLHLAECSNGIEEVV